MEKWLLPIDKVAILKKNNRQTCAKVLFLFSSITSLQIPLICSYSFLSP